MARLRGLRTRLNRSRFVASPHPDTRQQEGVFTLMATTVIMIIEHPNFRDQFRLMIRCGEESGWELQGGRFDDYETAVIAALSLKVNLKDCPIMVLGQE